MKKVRGFIIIVSLLLVGVILLTACTAKLGTPANLRVDGTTLKWDSVENAASYIVSINGTEYPATATNSYNLWEFRDSGCQIKVKAKYEGKFFDSNWSNTYNWPGVD